MVRRCFLTFCASHLSPMAHQEWHQQRLASCMISCFSATERRNAISQKRPTRVPCFLTVSHDTQLPCSSNSISNKNRHTVASWIYITSQYSSFLVYFPHWTAVNDLQGSRRSVSSGLSSFLIPPSMNARDRYVVVYSRLLVISLPGLLEKDVLRIVHSTMLVVTD